MQHPFQAGTDWQTLTALGIVVVTVLIFARMAIRKARNAKAGCGEACTCPTVEQRKIIVRKH